MSWCVNWIIVFSRALVNLPESLPGTHLSLKVDALKDFVVLAGSTGLIIMWRCRQVRQSVLVLFLFFLNCFSSRPAVSFGYLLHNLWTKNKQRDIQYTDNCIAQKLEPVDVPLKISLLIVLVFLCCLQVENVTISLELFSVMKSALIIQDIAFIQPEKSSNKGNCALRLQLKFKPWKLLIVLLLLLLL